MIALLGLVLFAALAAMGAGLVGGRLDWLTDHQIVALFLSGLLVSLAVAMVAALALPFSAMGRGRVPAWLVLVIVGVAPLAASVSLIGTDRLRQPLIHDITTDVRNPPPFVFIADIRGPRDNPVMYGGQRLAALQRLHYPDIQPLELPVEPARTFAMLVDLLQSEGLELVGMDGDAYRIEATWRSPWLRLHHDVVVRVSPLAGGSRIDIRSASRVGGADLGVNAALVRNLLARSRTYPAR